MRNKIGELFNKWGNGSADAGKPTKAERYYKLASFCAPHWSVPWYNLGLLTKNSLRWKESLAFNQRALVLNPDDEGACWNLGIAATALHYWPEARRAWARYGIAIDDGQGEINGPRSTACVRLDPSGEGEVVWGERLDPARFLILSVPLPNSNRRFRDVLLNDGASNGTREHQGVEIPVFDELAVWRPSPYSTFEATLAVPNEESRESLVEICQKSDVGVEDWSTVSFVCAECSRGNLGPHDCKPVKLSNTSMRFGLAGRSSDQVLRTLKDWTESNADSQFDMPRLVLPAQSQ